MPENTKQTIAAVYEVCSDKIFLKHKTKRKNYWQIIFNNISLFEQKINIAK